MNGPLLNIILLISNWKRIFWRWFHSKSCSKRLALIYLSRWKVFLDKQKYQILHLGGNVPMFSEIAHFSQVGNAKKSRPSQKSFIPYCVLRWQKHCTAPVYCVQFFKQSANHYGIPSPAFDYCMCTNEGHDILKAALEYRPKDKG